MHLILENLEEFLSTLVIRLEGLLSENEFVRKMNWSYSGSNGQDRSLRPDSLQKGKIVEEDYTTHLSTAFM